MNVLIPEMIESFKLSVKRKINLFNHQYKNNKTNNFKFDIKTDYLRKSTLIEDSIQNNTDNSYFKLVPNESRMNTISYMNDQTLESPKRSIVSKSKILLSPVIHTSMNSPTFSFNKSVGFDLMNSLNNTNYNYNTTSPSTSTKKYLIKDKIDNSFKFKAVLNVYDKEYSDPKSLKSKFVSPMNRYKNTEGVSKNYMNTYGNQTLKSDMKLHRSKFKLILGNELVSRISNIIREKSQNLRLIDMGIKFNSKLKKKDNLDYNNTNSSKFNKNNIFVKILDNKERTSKFISIYKSKSKTNI